MSMDYITEVILIVVCNLYGVFQTGDLCQCVGDDGVLISIEDLGFPGG